MPVDTVTVDNDIVLRRPSPASAEDIYALVEANRAYLAQWLSFMHVIHSAKDERAWIEDMLATQSARWEYPLMVLHKGVLVGMIGVQALGSRARFCEIGYWLDEEAQGRGIITRSCRALIDYVFTSEGINRVQIRAAVGNTRSRAIPERLGFSFEGVLRQADLANGQFLDMAMYSMLANEWREQRQTATTASHSPPKLLAKRKSTSV